VRICDETNTCAQEEVNEILSGDLQDEFDQIRNEGAYGNINVYGYEMSIKLENILVKKKQLL